MEIIIDTSTYRKYRDEILNLRVLSAEYLGNHGVVITMTTKSEKKIHILKEGHLFEIELDYTVEVHVELSESAKNKALDVDMPLAHFQDECGNFFHEAKALRKIVEMKRPFGIKVVCVSYLPPKQ